MQDYGADEILSFAEESLTESTDCINFAAFLTAPVEAQGEVLFFVCDWVAGATRKEEWPVLPPVSTIDETVREVGGHQRHRIPQNTQNGLCPSQKPWNVLGMEG